jgi:hypothetical protein
MTARCDACKHGEKEIDPKYPNGVYFAVGSLEMVHKVRCRRFPPTMDANGRARWTFVRGDDRCGEFSA